MRSGRATALRNLVWLAVPLDESINVLSKYGWDSEDAVAFDAAPVISILARYLEGDLSVETIVRWAELIESREDIEFHKNALGDIDDLIFTLANPYMEGSLTPEVAIAMRSKLEAL